MQQVTLELPQKRLLLIESQVIESIYEFQQLDHSSKESGGILIGEYRGEHLRIVHLTKPGFLDTRQRFRFYRLSPHHQIYAYKCWIKSHHVQTWIGEWHTHPEDHPTPSFIDIENWNRKLPERLMILIIQGRISRWYGFWDGKKLIEVKK